MKKLFVLTISVFLVCAMPVPLLASGTGTIKGVVRSSVEKEAASGAAVLLARLGLRTTTNRDGVFMFSGLEPGMYDIEVSFIGYKRERIRNVEVIADKGTEVSVFLADSPFLLNEVVVTGALNQHLLKNTPVVTEVVGRQELSSIGSSDLAEIMRNQTGIEIGTGIGQTQSARLLGLRKNQVLVLVDGERMTGKVDDAIDLGQIPVNMIEKIEIVKGPLSSIYGSDALGGVVNIITKDPKSSPALALSATGGTYGRQDYLASAATSLGNVFGENRSVSVLVNTGWSKFFGVDYDERDGFMEMPEYDRKNVDLKTVVQIDGKLFADIKLDIYTDKTSWQAGKSGVGAGTLYYVDRGSNDKRSATASATYTFSPSTSLKFSAHISSNDHGSSEETTTGFLVRENKTGETIQTYRGQLSTTPYESSFLTIGIESNTESANSGRILGGSKRFINNVVYGEDEWTFSSVTLSAGGRYSDNSVYGSFFAPRVSLLYRASDHLTLRSSYGRGFRAPSILELFIDYPNTSVGYQVVGAPSLKPETSHGLTIGMDYARDDLIWFRANAYYNSVTNLIDYFLVSSPPVVYSYRNISNAKTAGLDVDVDFHPTEAFAVGLGYNYSLAQDDNGNQIPFHSPHTIILKLLYSMKQIGLTSSLRARWYDKKLVIDEQTNVSSVGSVAQPFYDASFAIVDFKVSKTLIAGFDLSGGINNVADRVSYPFGQIKGREFYLGLSYKID